MKNFLPIPHTHTQFAKSFAFLLLLLSSFILDAQDQPPYVTAVGNQIYCPGTPMPIVEDFNITDPDDTGTNAIYIQISAGYVNGQDFLSLPAGHPTITATWNAASGKLTLMGVGGEVPYTALIDAVKDVLYTNNNANPSGSRNFSITVGAANYLPSTGHYYMFIPSPGITWTNAKIAAENSFYFGLQGYLATLTTQEEALLCGQQASGNGWIGGSDAAVEGVWRWMTGPEAGTIFWNGGINGSTPNFAFWNNGEPNNQGEEDYAHITAPGIGILGSWNDLPNAGGGTPDYAAQGYLVEYGGMPGDPVLNISASTVISFPKITGNTPASRCSDGPVTLAAVASFSATVHWYTSATGATEVATGATFTTPSLTATTTYYASAYGSSCTTAPRTAVIATVNPLPTITTTAPVVNICQGSTATLQATPSAGTVSWFTTATGGTPVGTGASFTTPPVSANTSYYAEALSAQGCASATRVEVAIVTNPQPTVVIPTPAALCGPGIVTLQATPSAGNVSWYTAATGGTAVGTGNSYTTPTITVTTTYYAEALDNACASASRQAVTVTVNPVPVINLILPATICSGETATLTVNIASGATINWYDAATGGTLLGTGPTFTTPALTATTTYHAEAVGYVGGCLSDGRTAATVTVIPPPTLTVTTPVTTCNGSTATISATPAAGATVNWYTTATGGTAVGTGNTFTTPAITTATTYYAEAVSGACISATRTAVVINVSTLPTVTTTTPPPICGQGTATLQATPSAGTINWYDAATGGTLIGTGNSITSPLITATTTFYAEAVSATCSSATRQPVIVTIIALPTISATANGVICAMGTATLGATPSSGTINWYATATGGTILATGPTFTTPTLSTTTNFYAEAISPEGCVSAIRTPIEALVLPLPTVTVTTPTNVCGPVTATLEGVASAGTIEWYDAPTGGNLIGTGSSIQSPVITSNRTFYAQAVDNGCASLTRVAVDVIFDPLPAVGPDETILFCENGDIEIDADITGVTYDWSTGETTQIITIDTPGTYTVTVTSPAGCTATRTFTASTITAPDIRNVVVNSNDILVVLANNDPENYEFSLDGGPYQDSPQFNDLQNGYHTVSALSRNGCGEDSYTFLVFIIPKFFTPNGDNINDGFTLAGMNLFPEVTVNIFDRYGKLITQLSRSNRTWDGTFNGQQLPATDYWYVVKISDMIPEIRGHFSLMR